VTGCQPPTSLHCYKNGQFERSVAIEAGAKMYLPWWHQWWSRDANRPAGSIAVTLSQVDSTGGISHFGGCYNTQDAAQAPNNRNWAQLIIVFFYLGLVLRLFGDSLNCAVCDTVGDFAAAAMADNTLQHQCMYALVVCSLDPASFAADVLRVLDACAGTAMTTSGRRAFPRPSWDEMLQNYALRTGESGTGESGLLDRMGIFVTCDGQPARALLGLKRSKFYCFPGGFHMTLELWRCVQKLFWECLLLQEFTMWRLGEGQEKYIYSPSDPTQLQIESSLILLAYGTWIAKHLLKTKRRSEVRVP
jgi:hypothetical protein